MEPKCAFPPTASEYQLFEEIGHGTSAIVYSAMCKPLKVVVAVKCLDLERCNSNLDDIRREAQLMSLIDHPNVIIAYCSFIVDHYLWVVMPYMDGGSCSHIMKVSHPDGFEEQIIATILRETLKALDYLHRQGHIHRDVKAGNILIDKNGAIKLGDYGISACMFERGDRKWGRNTFVGTPCWMAPEVMEQKDGYNFRADIWSFGITALELAHGHAPFSKYPPAKVFLMTIQNPPPRLNHENDKRFSNTFREMVSICLVKDPNKRPTADKLLKHPFFKQARSGQYVAEHLLSGLKPLWVREKILQERDAARIAKNLSAYVDQEVQSQNEYRRNVSAWNFDIEDLKAQAALIQDDDWSSIIEDKVETLSASSSRESITSEELLPKVAKDAMSIQPGHSSVIVPPLSLSADNRRPEQLSTGRKEPRQIGRFGVFEGDLELESPGWHECVRQQRIIINEGQPRDGKVRRIVEDQGEVKQSERKQRTYKASSGQLVTQKSGTATRDTDREYLVDEPLASTAAIPEQCHADGVTESVKLSSGNINSFDERVTRLTTQRNNQYQMTLVDTKTTEDSFSSQRLGRIQVQNTFFHKSASAGDALAPSEWKHLSLPQVTSNSVAVDTSIVPTAIIIPQLQNLLMQTASQHETIFRMLKSVSPSDSLNEYSRHHLLSYHKADGGEDAHLGSSLIEQEQEFVRQISELQSKMSILINELQSVKMRNVQLERQLNAIYNRKEEKKIQREEAENK